jgi:hypothetical protein
MKNAILCLAIASVIVAPLRAACDCTHVPIRPEACVIPCQNALLMKLSKEDLTGKLKLSQSTADAVIDKRENGAAPSVRTMKDSMTNSEYSELLKKLDALKPADFKELASKYGTTNVPESRIRDGAAEKTDTKATKK